MREDCKRPLGFIFGHDRMLPLLAIGERLHPELDEAYISNPDETICDPLSGADLTHA